MEWVDIFSDVGYSFQYPLIFDVGKLNKQDRRYSDLKLATFKRLQVKKIVIKIVKKLTKKIVKKICQKIAKKMHQKIVKKLQKIRQKFVKRFIKKFVKIIRQKNHQKFR